MLKSTQLHLRIMTLSRTGPKELTAEEWDELNALRKAINYDPHTVCHQKMEKFTELLVRSLHGKGDPVFSRTKPTNY